MIPPETTEEELQNIFSPFGELLHVHVMRNQNGEGKGKFIGFLMIGFFLMIVF
jgi:RNA recognition motif-containing protein